MRRAALVLGLAASAFVGTSHAAPAPAPTTLQSLASPALALAALDRRIADIDAEEQSAKTEMSALGGQIADAHGRVLAQGRAFYRLTRSGMLPLGGGFGQLVSHAMHVERARRALANDIVHEKDIRDRGVELAHALERISRDRVSLATQRTEMDAARIAMQDEQRREAAFDKAFESSTGASEYVAVYGGAGASQDDDSRAGFASARGRLLFPVAGRAEVRPAKREGTDGPGLEIQAALGTPVRAPYAGRVAFTDRYGPYGRIVILDHGDHYYTVCGNLASADVKVGDDVASGQRIGTVGDEGQGAMLYFEVRHGSQTVPPGPWLGL
jgi:murein DD-endopeptidase MepM/ murein hydrolase activator NlpD